MMAPRICKGRARRIAVSCWQAGENRGGAPACPAGGEARCLRRLLARPRVAARSWQANASARPMLPKRDWLDMTWQDLAEADTARWIAALPVAAVEQH